MQLIGSESPYKYVLRFHLLYLLFNLERNLIEALYTHFPSSLSYVNIFLPFSFIYLLRFYFFLIVNTIQMCDIECIITIDVSQCLKIRYT